MESKGYYAVIFTSIRTKGDNGYKRMSEKMEELAAEQPGFLGIESAREDRGTGITVSYWESLEAIKAWKAHSEHKIAQKFGKEKWYQDYTVRICRVEHAYDFHKTEGV